MQQERLPKIIIISIYKYHDNTMNDIYFLEVLLDWRFFPPRFDFRKCFFPRVLYFLVLLPPQEHPLACGFFLQKSDLKIEEVAFETSDAALETAPGTL
jgi:hypothetical protein